MDGDLGVHIYFGIIQKLARLTKLGEQIMSAISDFAVKQNEFNDKLGAALQGIEGDIKKLNADITKIQNSPGTITPEDQATLDSLQQKGQALADKFSALDELTPPEVPVEPGTPEGSPAEGGQPVEGGEGSPNP